MHLIHIFKKSRDSYSYLNIFVSVYICIYLCIVSVFSLLDIKNALIQTIKEEERASETIVNYKVYGAENF